MLREAHTAADTLSSQAYQRVLQRHGIPESDGNTHHVDSTYLQVQTQVGQVKLLEWKKRLAEERGRVSVVSSEIRERMALELQRHKYFQDLAGQIHAAKESMRQQEPTLVGHDWCSTNVGELVDSLAERLNATGPQPLLVLREAEERMTTIDSQDVGFVQGILERNREGGVGELSETQGNNSSGDVVQQQLRARRRVAAQQQLTEDLVAFVDERTASVVVIIGCLKAALATAKAREEIISAEIRGLLKGLKSFMAHVQDAKDAVARAAPPQAPAPLACPKKNSIFTLLDTSWVEGYFYEGFVARARGTNDTDALFYASELLSRSRTWYHESETLGEGAFGTVTKVDVHTTGESFAVKSLKGDGTGDKEFERSRDALLVEMLICTRVAPHANVLQAVAVDDRVVTDMKIMYELADGDFTSCAWGDTEDSVGTIMRYLSEAAMGVAHLASNGFVQNDIKPGNILLLSPAPGCENGRAVLADFGIALEIGDERLGEGTAGSRPPEARRRVACHPSAEVFSMAHTCLMTLSKRKWTEDNMFASEAVMTDFDKECLDMTEDIAKFHAYRESLTHHNMLDPGALAILLDPDHLRDDLKNEKTEFIRVVGLALQSDPALRPTLEELVASLTSMSGRLLAAEQATATAGNDGDAEATPPQMAPLAFGSGSGGAEDDGSGAFGTDSGGIDDPAILCSGAGGGGIDTGSDGGSNIDVFGGHVGSGGVNDTAMLGNDGTGSDGGSKVAVFGGNVGGGRVAGGGGRDGGGGGCGVASSDRRSDVHLFDVEANCGGVADGDEGAGGGNVVAVISGNVGGGGGGGGGGGVFDTGSGAGGSAIPPVPRQASGGGDAASPSAGGKNGGTPAVGMAAGGSSTAPMPKYPIRAAAGGGSPVAGGTTLNGLSRYMPRAIHAGRQRVVAMPFPQHQRNSRHKSRRGPKPTSSGAASPPLSHHHQGFTRQGVGIGVGRRGHQQAARSRVTGETGGAVRRPQHSGSKANSRKGTVHRRQGRQPAVPWQRKSLPRPEMGRYQGRSARFPCSAAYPSGPPTPPSPSQPTSGAPVYGVGPGVGAVHPCYDYEARFTRTGAEAWGSGSRLGRSPFGAARAPNPWCPALHTGSWTAEAGCGLPPPYCGLGCGGGAPAIPQPYFFVWVPVPCPPAWVWVPCR